MNLKSITDQNLIETLKGFLAHQHPGMTTGELFEKLCELGLREWDPSKTAAPRKRRVKISEAGNRSVRTSSIAGIRRSVFQNARNKCENCGSTYALEIDHIRPKALGGNSEEGNLRVLCRHCNQRAAIEAFGVRKMEKYLASPP